MVFALSAGAMDFPEGGDQNDCPKPNMVSVQFISDTSAVVSWQQSDSVTSMKILVTDLNDPGMTIETEPVSSPFVLTGLAACGLYGVQLASTCGDSISEYTEAIIIETDAASEIKPF